MLDALAKLDGAGQPASGEFRLPEPGVSDAGEVRSIRLTPGVAALRIGGAVERQSGLRQRGMGIEAGQVGTGEGEAEVDDVEATPVGLGMAKALLGFGDGSAQVAGVEGQVRGEAMGAELDFDITGALNPGAGEEEIAAGFL